MISIFSVSDRFANIFRAANIYRLSLLIFLVSALLVPTSALAQDISTSHHFDEVCFAVADERDLPGDPNNQQDTLTSLDPATAVTQIVGTTGTSGIEAMSFGPALQLFAANGGQLGTLNPTTGAFTALPQPFGSADGSVGNVSLNDIDGLAFSLTSNMLYATHRRSDSSAAGPRPDVLFAIDPVTGAHIPNHFGPVGGPFTDYVVVPAVLDDEGNSLTDIDDIQFDPVSGILFGVADTDGRSGVLVSIDIATGVASPIATFRYAANNEIIDDVEGMSFANDGTLYASTGDNFSSDPDDLNKLFNIDPTTGLGVLIGPFPVGPKDYEALACLTAEAAIVLKKYTNGPGQAPADADLPTGPFIEVDAPVTWTYIFTNTSILALTNLKLEDDQEGVIAPNASGTCLTADTVLAPGASLTCTATGTAQAGQYANIGTVSGDAVPTLGFPAQRVTDTNPSHYFGSLPGINIIKLTNGPGQLPDDADTPTGPQIMVGDTVTWTYEVRNTGNVALSNVTVADNIAGVTPTYVSGDTDTDTLLDLAEVWFFQATGTAVPGQYANIGTVTGTPPVGPDVQDDNPSHYFGALPGINIIKLTNGDDADTPTGPQIEIGGPVTWTYEVRNTGNVALSNVTVTDNIAGVTPVYVSGDTDADTLLDLAEVWLFQASGIAVAGQYANVGTVTGTPPTGPNVQDDNPSHYFGVPPGTVAGINIIKFTNGEDADTPTGPQIQIGGAVTWTYEVRNTGDVVLSSVTVTDNITGVTPVYVSGDTNNDTLLDLDEVWLFQDTGTANAGQYANIGTVTGTPPTGPDVQDDNPSHYFGVPPGAVAGINIIKFTNGEDADTPRGPEIEVDEPVIWTYEVRNTGDVVLSDITVSDNIAGVTPVYVSGDTDTDTLLDLDEVWLFQASGIAVEGQYANIGSVTGTPPDGPDVQDDNPSHYFGVDSTDPTNLPEEEQPQQRRSIYLPTVQSE